MDDFNKHMKKIMCWVSTHTSASLLIGLIIISAVAVKLIPSDSPASSPPPPSTPTSTPTSIVPSDVPSEALDQQIEENAAAKKAAQAAAQEAFDSTPAGKICKAHPTWQQDECTELANNNLWITNAAHPGMTYDMLVYLRGEADATNVSDYGNGEQYQYCWDGFTPSCFYDRDGDGRMDAFN